MKFVCRWCESDLEYEQNDTVAVCPKCGNKWAIPQLDDEDEIFKYDSAMIIANQGRLFDRKEEVLIELWQNHKNDADLIWEILLAKYGVEYYGNPLKLKVGRFDDTPATETMEYRKVLQLADEAQKELFTQQAGEILRSQMQAIAYKYYYSAYNIPIDIYLDVSILRENEDDFTKMDELCSELKIRGYHVFTTYSYFPKKPDIEIEDNPSRHFQHIIAATIAKCYICITNLKEREYSFPYYSIYKEKLEPEENTKSILVYTDGSFNGFFSVSINSNDPGWKAQVFDAVEQLIGKSEIYQSNADITMEEAFQKIDYMKNCIEEQKEKVDANNEKIAENNEILIRLRETIDKMQEESANSSKADAGIFISYSSKELSEAGKMRDMLKEAGRTCWMAPESIPAGSDYGNEIASAINGCDILVIMLSENSQNSKWVSKELDFAMKYDKLIIPFQIDDSELLPAFDFRLTDVQRIYAKDRFEEAFQELMERIG